MCRRADLLLSGRRRRQSGCASAAQLLLRMFYAGLLNSRRARAQMLPLTELHQMRMHKFATAGPFAGRQVLSHTQLEVALCAWFRGYSTDTAAVNEAATMAAAAAAAQAVSARAVAAAATATTGRLGLTSVGTWANA